MQGTPQRDAFPELDLEIGVFQKIHEQFYLVSQVDSRNSLLIGCGKVDLDCSGVEHMDSYAFRSLSWYAFGCGHLDRMRKHSKATMIVRSNLDLVFSPGDQLIDDSVPRILRSDILLVPGQTAVAGEAVSGRLKIENVSKNCFEEIDFVCNS